MEPADAKSWTRDSTWRQGHILKSETLAALGIFCPEDPDNTCVVVVSHDCDLAQDPSREASVEVIVGRFVSKPDPMYTHARSPRLLHLGWKEGDEEVLVELESRRKQHIAKINLAHHLPEIKLKLPQDGLVELRCWLAARYNRVSLPDAFMKQFTRVEDKIAKAIATANDVISAQYVTIDTLAEIQNTQYNAYRITIVLTFAPGKNAEQSESKAVKVSEAVSQIFAKMFLRDADSGSWEHIQLLSCLPISENALTVGRAKRMHQIRWEYLSFRAGPEENAVSAIGTNGV
jgi:hypothetical protein